MHHTEVRPEGTVAQSAAHVHRLQQRGRHMAAGAGCLSLVRREDCQPGRVPPLRPARDGVREAASVHVAAAVVDEPQPAMALRGALQPPLVAVEICNMKNAQA